MAPRFWYRPPGLLLRLIGRLAPGRGPARTKLQDSPVPVISVRSLSLGGTGKTPGVIAIAQRLAMQGKRVHVVTRGAGPALRIDERAHDPAIVGDEPLLIAAFAPTWRAADPLCAIAAAAQEGAEVIVHDGSAQEAGIAAAVQVIVEDAVRGFGNGIAWPLGPLKRRVSQGLAGADLLIAVGAPTAQKAFRSAWGTAVPCPIVPAQLVALETGMEWAGLNVVAFAGIGAPERFFATLKGLGAHLVRAQALSDHQELTPALMARLEKQALATHAQLVTTEKDAVRLPRAFRQKVVSLPVRLELEDWGRLDALLG